MQISLGVSVQLVLRRDRISFLGVTMAPSCLPSDVTYWIFHCSFWFVSLLELADGVNSQPCVSPCRALCWVHGWIQAVLRGWHDRGQGQWAPTQGDPDVRGRDSVQTQVLCHSQTCALCSLNGTLLSCFLCLLLFVLSVYNIRLYSSSCWGKNSAVMHTVVMAVI